MRGLSPLPKKEKKKEKKKKGKKERKKGTMNNVKLLHILKCCFFQFFNSPVALKNKKKFGSPEKSLNDAPGREHLHWACSRRSLFNMCI